MKAQACIEVLDVEEGVDFAMPHADTVLQMEKVEVYDDGHYISMIRLWILHRPGAE